MLPLTYCRKTGRYTKTPCSGCACAPFVEQWPAGRSRANKKMIEMILRLLLGGV